MVYHNVAGSASFTAEHWLCVVGMTSLLCHRYDITKTPLVDVLKTLLLVLEKLIEDEETQVN